MKADVKSKRVAVVLNFDSLDQCKSIRDNVDRLSQSGLVYYGILHDKDTDKDGVLKTPHYHLVISSTIYKRGKTWLILLSDVFKLKENQISIETCDDWIASIQYLVHLNAKDKFQYDYHNIFTNDSIDSLESILSTENNLPINVSTLTIIYTECDGNRLRIIDTIGFGRYHSMRNAINDVLNQLDKEYYLRLQNQGARETLDRSIKENDVYNKGK